MARKIIAQYYMGYHGENVFVPDRENDDEIKVIMNLITIKVKTRRKDFYYYGICHALYRLYNGQT